MEEAKKNRRNMKRDSRKDASVGIRLAAKDEPHEGRQSWSAKKCQSKHYPVPWRFPIVPHKEAKNYSLSTV